MTSISRYSLLGVLMFCGLTNAAWAKESGAPDWNAETVTGDWGGVRQELYDAGVDIGLLHKSDVLSNVSGGLRRGTAWLGHTAASVSLDMEKLLGWDAATAYFNYHSNLGSKFNSHYVGSFMGVDNIEVATNTGQFYHAWIQKGFFKDSLSVLAGLYPIDSEFYVTDASDVFLHPTYGMANDLAQTGRNGPPVFPMGALGVRVKYTSPGKNVYVQGALTDGVPGDPDNGHGTRIKLRHGDGTLFIAELGYTPQEETVSSQPADTVAKPEESESFNKTAIGFWRYTKRFDDLSMLDANGNPVRRRSHGAYVLAERMLYAEQGSSSQGLAGFVRFGTAPEHIHQADWTASVGLRYRGLFSGRDKDVAGVAVTVNHASGNYCSLTNAASNETDVEVTYRAQITPWLALQPTLQYIVRPGMDSTLKNAAVIGLGTVLAF